MTGRNLTPDEVEQVLDVLENMIAWTARVRQPSEQEQLDFIDIRENAHEVYRTSVAIIDGEEAEDET
jgi:hypothetical protein